MPRPDEDLGYFGPHSVTWRIHGAASTFIGGMRALLMQALHPRAMAGVDQHSDFREHPWRRLARTIQYVVINTYGTTAEADEAAANVRRLHRSVRGIDPVTGRPYAADDHDLLLWVHAGEVDSYLEAYRAFGSGLSDKDADRYVAERVRSVELLGLPPDRAPATVADLKDYIEATSGDLVLSDAARGVRDLVLNSPLRFPLNTPLRLPGAAAVVILPGFARSLYQVRWPRPIDVGVRLSGKAMCMTLGPFIPDGPLVRRAKRRARELQEVA
ncbi:MAG: oxygenase MpaB family protein [Actinomycetota bacterium]